MKALRRLDELAIHHSAVIQNISDIYKTAVSYRLEEIFHLVKMNDTLLVRFYNLLWQKHSLCQVFRHFPCNIVTLCGSKGGILIRILCF